MRTGPAHAAWTCCPNSGPVALPRTCIAHLEMCTGGSDHAPRLHRAPAAPHHPAHPPPHGAHHSGHTGPHSVHSLHLSTSHAWAPHILSRPARSTSTTASQPHLSAQPSPHEPAALHTPLHRTTPVPCTHTLTPTLTLTLLTSTPSAPHLQHGLTLALAPNPTLTLTPAQIPAPAPTLTAAPEP